MITSNNIKNIFIKVKGNEDIKKLCFIMLKGCYFQCKVKRTMKNILCEQIGIQKEYLSSIIQTIFLNGKVIDSPNKAVVCDKDEIGLSAAMPGLVGAMLRKQEILSPMRSSISSTYTKKKTKYLFLGFIKLKLFNLLIKELGSMILKSGHTLLYIQTLYDFLNDSGMKNIKLSYDNSIFYKSEEMKIHYNELVRIKILKYHFST